MRTYFFENVFFFYLLYPWKSQTNSSIPGNCAKLRYIPWKFQDQKPWPWKFNIIFSWSRLCGNSTCYFFDTPGNSISSAQSPLPMFVFFLVFFIWVWLVFHPSWFFPLRTGGKGGGGLLNGQNPLSVTKVICRQSLN